LPFCWVLSISPSFGSMEMPSELKIFCGEQDQSATRDAHYGSPEATAGSEVSPNIFYLSGNPF
jgi:hypothetical protein